MTKRKEVSEKSLELNVCAELLQRIRSWQDCRGAVWLGMTQLQERENGLDQMISNAPGVAMMLQFKAPVGDFSRGLSLHVHHKWEAT